MSNHITIRDVHVSVRTLSGQEWHEQWPIEKLAYFVLMSDIDPPKFDNCLLTEWVPYDVNMYKWDKNVLSREEFARIAAQWPGLVAVDFDATACDWVQISYETKIGGIGFGFTPSREPALFSQLLSVSRRLLVYSGFNYGIARHVFEAPWDLGAQKQFLGLAPAIREALNRLYEGSVRDINDRRAENLTVKFLLRHGTFEPPYTLWFEA